MSQFVTLLGLFTFIVGLVLGVYVFSRNPKSRVFQAFALSALGMVGWNLSIFLLLTEIGPALIPGRLGFSFVTMIAVGLATFALIFPRPVKFAKQIIILNGIIGAIFFAIPLLPQFLSYVEIVDGHITGDLNLELFGYWTLHYIIVLVLTFFFLTIRTLREKGVNRGRLRHILLGYGLFLWPMLMTQVVLPLFFFDFRWNNLGPVFTIFLVVFLANAIASYRLLNIRWVLGKSVVFSSIVIAFIWFVSTFYLFVAELLSEEYSLIIAALLIALTFEPIAHFLERIVTKVLGGGSYDPQKTQEAIFEIVRIEGEVERLTSLLLQEFEKMFSAKSVGMAVLGSKSKKVLAYKEIGYKKSPMKHMRSILTMASSRNLDIVEAGELEWKLRFPSNAKEKTKLVKDLELLRKVGIEDLVPFVVEGRLVGLLYVGDRNNANALRDSDIKYLNLIRSAIAPALANAAKFGEIKQLYEELSELDKAKSEFINVVSHRFRTPLSAIRWNLETVLDVHGKKIGKEVSEALADSQDRTLFLVETLDRLFDSLAIESGKLKLHTENFSTKDTFNAVVDEYKRRCEEKGLTCNDKIQSFEAWGDDHRLASVLRSLTANALQYTNEGSVDISVKKDGEELVMEVKDTGIGISPAAKKKIFEKFFRAKNAILTYADGQGLGMYYCKEIVDRHGGSIEVESKLNQGTVVTVRLPIKKEKKAPAKKGEAVKKTSARTKKK